MQVHLLSVFYFSPARGSLSQVRYQTEVIYILFFIGIRFHGPRSDTEYIYGVYRD